jgi:hypothetical protein
MVTSTKQNKASTPTTPFDFPSVDDATQRVRDLNERMIASSKSAGLVALDTIEKALQSVGDFEQKIASASQLDWVSAAATTHSKFLSDVSDSYTTAVRDLLK